MILPVEIEDLESAVRSCSSAHTVECNRNWCPTCILTAAGGSFFQCNSNDLFYNRLHTEAFPEVVSSASAGEEISNPANGDSISHTTTPAEMQTLLARIALVTEEGGDMLGVVADIQEWLLSLSDTDEGSWVNLCVRLSEVYKDTIGEARGISDELHRNQKTHLDKLEEAEKALNDLQQTLSRNERTLADELDVLASERKAWRDREKILLDQLKEEQVNKNTPDIEEIHALLARIESAYEVGDAEDVILGTKEWLDQQPDPDHGVSLKSLCAGLAELCRRKADEARSSRNNEQRLVTLQEVRQSTEALRTDQERNLPASKDIQRLLACISLVSNDNGDTLPEKEELGTIDEIRDWLAVRPDVAVNNSSQDFQNWALRRSLQESLNSNERLGKQLDKVSQRSREQEANLEQTSHNERTLGEQLEETRNSLINLQQRVNKITPAAEEIHALLKRIDSVADGVEDVISGTKKWLDQQPDPDQGVSFRSLCIALTELCRCQADKARKSRRNKKKISLALQEERQTVEVLQTRWERNKPAAGDIQRLQGRISLVADDKDEKLTDDEEFAAIDEVRNWFAARPDADVSNSISKVSSTLAQLCRDKIGKTWDLWTDLQKSRGNEEDLEEQLREAQAVARALQDELHQALYMYRAANPHSPYEMTVIRTDPDYVDALGRTCWR